MTTVWARLVQHNARFLADAMRRWAEQLDAAAPGPPVVAFPILFTTGRETSVGQINVPDSSDPLNASVSFRDAKGYETSPEGTPAWSSSDEAVASVQASEDGLSASVTVGAPGATVIEVRETDSQGQEIVAQGTVTVQPGDAVIGEVNFSGGSPTAADEAPGDGEPAPEA